MEAFAAWWHTQTSFAQRVLIGGNHDLALDGEFVPETTAEEAERAEAERAHDCAVHERARALLHRPDLGSFLLSDSSVTVSAGFNVWGSPWQPAFWGAFNLPRGRELAEKWAKIPGGTDVVLTHTPPEGHGDYVPRSRGKPHVGCEALSRELLGRVRPLVSVFGHVHEGAGVSYAQSALAGRTAFVNASTCTVDYEAANPPVVFQLRRSAEGGTHSRVVGYDEDAE